MKVAVVGGGPAGLYFSLLLKHARPDIRAVIGRHFSAMSVVVVAGLVEPGALVERPRQ